MAKEAGATHKATPRRIKNAREEGNITQSKDLALWFSLIIFLIFIYMGEWFVKRLYQIIVISMNLIEKGITPRDFFVAVGWEAAKLIFVIIIAIVISMIINYSIQVRFIFSMKIIKPQIKRLNPKNYFQRIFSKKTGYEVVKSFIVVVILGFLVFLVFKSEINTMISAINMPWKSSLLFMWSMFKSIVVKIIIIYGVISIADYFMQKHFYNDDLKMKLEDIKREQKDQNGSPEVKGRQRQVMIAMLRNEVRKVVPDSTMVITNPTHYAVALRYKKGQDDVPVVLAKGIDHLALFIKEIAKENEIPIIENPKLARDIYTRCVEEENIPVDMYLVVSQILTDLMNKGKIKK